MAQQGPSDAISTAKNVLAGAKKFSRSADPNGSLAPKAPVAAPAPVAHPAQKAPSVGDELAAKAANVRQYSAALPKMHTGGDVPATGDYKLQAGEHVTPAGRASEYRKVFLQRKQKNGSSGE